MRGTLDDRFEYLRSLASTACADDCALQRRIRAIWPPPLDPRITDREGRSRAPHLPHASAGCCEPAEQYGGTQLVERVLWRNEREKGFGGQGDNHTSTSRAAADDHRRASPLLCSTVCSTRLCCALPCSSPTFIVQAHPTGRMRSSCLHAVARRAATARAIKRKARAQQRRHHATAGDISCGRTRPNAAR